MEASAALHAIVPLMETKAGLSELAGALYDAASESFDAHDIERWRELGDLAEYVARVADNTPAGDTDPLEQWRAARNAIVGR